MREKRNNVNQNNMQLWRALHEASHLVFHIYYCKKLNNRPNVIRVSIIGVAEVICEPLISEHDIPNVENVNIDKIDQEKLERTKFDIKQRMAGLVSDFFWEYSDGDKVKLPSYLSYTLGMNFSDSDIHQVLDYLNALHGQKIQTDYKAMLELYNDKLITLFEETEVDFSLLHNIICEVAKYLLENGNIEGNEINKLVEHINELLNQIE